MRCDANVSVRRAGEQKFGTRAEIKNVNSVKYLIKSIDFEVERQIAILENGGTIVQETRLFDASNGETRSMRSKEDAHDYRYFADPDLLPLVLDPAFVQSIKDNLPELPDAKKMRYTTEMGLSAYDASVLVAEKAIAQYFEEVAAKVDPKLASNWITAELFGRLNAAEKSINDSPVSAIQLTELLALIQDGTISGKIAKQVFDIMFTNGGSPKEIVQAHGLVQVSDSGMITKIIEQVLTDNPDKVAEYKSGKDKLFAFFVGQVMKVSQGKANPGMVNELLKQMLA